MKRLTERGFSEVAQRFRLLSDPGRLRILDLLRRHGERPVGEIAEAVGCSVPQASRQLAQLHAAELLGRRREGTTVYYGITAEWIFGVCELVCGQLEAQAGAPTEPLFESSSEDGEDHDH